MTVSSDPDGLEDRARLSLALAHAGEGAPRFLCNVEIAIAAMRSARSEERRRALEEAAALVEEINRRRAEPSFGQEIAAELRKLAERG